MDSTTIKWKRLPASTLLEVVIAMIIILVIFGLAMRIAAQVMQSSPSVQGTRARALLNDILIKEEVQGKFEAGEWVADSLFIKQAITPNNETVIVSLEVVDRHQRSLAQLKKIERP